MRIGRFPELWVLRTWGTGAPIGRPAPRFAGDYSLTFFRIGANAMSRKTPRTSGQSRSLRIESLEPRTMMSGSQIINVQGPVAPPSGEVATPSSLVSPVIGTLRTTNTGPFTAAQIRSIYGFDKLSLNGAGTTIAIVDAYDDPTLIQDLHIFDQKFGLPDPNVTIAKEIDGDGKPPRADAGWSTETAIDVEWAHAIAPGANILLCQASSAGTDDLMFMVDFARKFSGVSVVSMSFGSREFERSWNPSSWFDENQTDYDSDVMTTPQGHRPVSFVASSGDDGSPFVKYPSTSPNVLAVGGTVITAYQNLTRIGNASAGTVSATPFVASGPTNFASMSYDTETAWSKGGGGFSGVESRPAYQNGFNSNSMRSTPDVAYAATGFWIVDNGNWESAWGTSCGAPQWAALIALANQGRAQLGGDTLANTISDIYRLPATDFHDITTGSTGSYSSTVGFDETTGRGTPIANLLINDLIHSEYLPPPVKVWPPIGVVGIVGSATTSVNAATVSTVTTKPTTTSSTSRVGGTANSLFVSRLGSRARPTTHASDAADGLMAALFGLDERLS
jgi:subtilase family serine protease